MPYKYKCSCDQQFLWENCQGILHPDDKEEDDDDDDDVNNRACENNDNVKAQDPNDHDIDNDDDDGSDDDGHDGDDDDISQAQIGGVASVGRSHSSQCSLYLEEKKGMATATPKRMSASYETLKYIHCVFGNLRYRLIYSWIMTME